MKIYKYELRGKITLTVLEVDKTICGIDLNNIFFVGTKGEYVFIREILRAFWGDKVFFSFKELTTHEIKKFEKYCKNEINKTIAWINEIPQNVSIKLNF